MKCAGATELCRCQLGALLCRAREIRRDDEQTTTPEPRYWLSKRALLIGVQKPGSKLAERRLWPATARVIVQMSFHSRLRTRNDETG